jgi:hypothetical protein
MKTGRTLQELAAEIERQAASKHDFLADTRELTMLTVGSTSELHVPGSGEFPLRRLPHDQVADHLGIPRAYYSRLRQAHPALLDLNVNRLFRDLPQRRMVRTLDGQVRKGDFVQAGVVISNSEVGLGALVVQPLVYRLVCLNGMIADTATRRYHVGRQVDSDESQGVYRDETIRADDRAFWLKVRDVVRAAVEETRFAALVARLHESAESAPMQV